MVLRLLFLIAFFISNPVLRAQDKAFSGTSPAGASEAENSSSFYEDSALCRVHPIEKMGTARTEYAPVYYKGELVYIRQKRKPFILFNTWKRDKFFAMYSAERQDSVSFEKSKPFNKQMQNKYFNGPMCLTPDDSTMYFTRAASPALTRKAGKKRGGLKQQIFYTAMNDYGLAHTEIHPFTHNSFDYNCIHPTIERSGKKLYFASDMPGGMGGYDIYVCEWKDGDWDAPKNAGPSINSAGNETFPYMSEEDVLFFTSDTRPGLGGRDIFFAERTENGEFNEAQNAGAPINTPYDDFGIFILKDGKKGYLSSTRRNNNEDIYFFNNGKPRSVPVRLLFLDSLSTLSVPVTFTLNSVNGVVTQKLDAAQTFTTLLKQGKSFTISIQSPGHKNKTESRQLAFNDSLVTLALRPRSLKCIGGKVIDKDSRTPIEGVKVAIYDEDGNKYLDISTDASGLYQVCDLPLNKNLYIGSQKKPNYFTNTERFKASSDSDIVKDIYAQEIVVGKAIKVENIYFDQGKFNVRADAAAELDKLVRLMKDNPEVIIELDSHTDCRGAASSNMLLSDKRAKSSAAYLISKGIAANRVKGKGFGESRLLNDCKCEGKITTACSEEQHAMNRRTEFKVTGFLSDKPADKKTKGK